MNRLAHRRIRPAGGRDNGVAVVGHAPADMLPRGVLVLLGTACLVVVVAGLRGVADILAPVFLALMLAVTVSPLTQWLRRRGTPAWLAMTATIITSYAVLIALGGALLV